MSTRSDLHSADCTYLIAYKGLFSSKISRTEVTLFSTPKSLKITLITRFFIMLQRNGERGAAGNVKRGCVIVDLLPAPTKKC